MSRRSRQLATIPHLADRHHGRRPRPEAVGGSPSTGHGLGHRRGRAIVLVLGLHAAPPGHQRRARAAAGWPGRWCVEPVTEQVEGPIGPRRPGRHPPGRDALRLHPGLQLLRAVGLGRQVRVAPRRPPPTSTSRWPWPCSSSSWCTSPRSQARGVGGYFKHYVTQPFPMYLLPFNVFINLVEEIAKPITLALRLFGNLLSGALMLVAHRRPGRLEARRDPDRQHPGPGPQRDLEALRPAHRGHPGLHLRPAHHPVLRRGHERRTHGGTRTS